MKKKIQISERNLISLIKRIVLEQTVNPIRTNVNFTPAPLQTVNIPQAPVDPQVATGTMDMAAAQSLAQADAYQKQKLAQQKKNQTRVCPGGYKEPIDDVYRLCSGGRLVGELQKHLGITPQDNKFGPKTENALLAKYGMKTITKDDINKKSLESNKENIQTKQSNNSSGFIIIDKRYMGLPGNIYKAFKNKEGWINLTNRDNRTTVTTNCSKLKSNEYYKYFPREQAGWVTLKTTKNLSGLLNYYFCQTKTNSIDVTNEVKSALVNEIGKYFAGSAFTAIRKKDGNIHIKNEMDGVNLATSCGELNNNIFRRNYRIPRYNVGSTVELDNLSQKIKPLFCSTNK